MDVVMGEMTWKEASEALAERRIAFVPVGSTEQHGLHLPLATDAMQARALCVAAAGECAGMVTPTIPFGHSENHMRFPGTISIQGETLKLLVKDVVRSLERHGLRTVLLVNSHGGNVPALALAAQELNAESMKSGSRMRVLSVFWPDLVRDDLRLILEQALGTHADELETSLMLHTAPRSVRAGEEVDEVPELRECPGGDQDLLRSMLGTGVISIQTRTKSGTLGFPSLASADKGRRVLEAVTRKLVSLALALDAVEG